jgi:hypothetical protein
MLAIAVVLLAGYVVTNGLERAGPAQTASSAG